MIPYNHNIGLFFNDVLAKHSSETALRYSQHHYTYGDLSSLINRLTCILLHRDLKCGDVIAIGNSKQPMSYALMLASLKLGIAYVNLDLESPTHRNIKILQTCNPSILFYDDAEYKTEIFKLAKAQECPHLFLDENDTREISKEDKENHLKLCQLVDGSTVAYIMFTSGSTGMPKGVAVTHQNLLHFIAWGIKEFDVTENDNFANLSPMYFDNSVFDFYVALYSGASLTPIKKELLSKPDMLVEHLEEMACTIWFSVPSLLIYLMTMKVLKANRLSLIRLFIFGGEGYPKAELKKLYDLYSYQAKLVNVYGPTECTCICSAHTIVQSDFTSIQGLPTLGHLNPNFDYQILDDEGQDSNIGELCLIGPNVSSGYYNDIKRTEVSFHTLYSPSRFMKRMYKTGDIVKEEQGKLYFIGRKDNQVKHMGYRIELEEIEGALTSLKSVSQAAVIYKRLNEAYGKIFAFVSADPRVEDKELHFELKQLLPEYMLPAKIMVQKELLKNSNGKVDRKHLHELI